VEDLKENQRTFQVSKKIELYKKIHSVQSKVSMIEKNGFVPLKSGKKKYDYERLQDVLQALSLPLKDHGLIVLNDLIKQDEVPALITKVICIDTGEEVSSIVAILGAEKILYDGNSMQNLGSAISYARRYNLRNIFNLVGYDDDGKSLDPSPKPNKPKPVKVTDDQKEKIISLVQECTQNENIEFDPDAFKTYVGPLENLTSQKAQECILTLNKRVSDAKAPKSSTEK